MLAWKLYGDGETPASTGMKGDHLVGKYYVEFDKHYKAQIKELMAEGQSEEEAKKNAPIMREAHLFHIDLILLGVHLTVMLLL